MPIRRPLELSVKTLVENVLADLNGMADGLALSSIRDGFVRKRAVGCLYYDTPEGPIGCRLSHPRLPS